MTSRTSYYRAQPWTMKRGGAATALFAAMTCLLLLTGGSTYGSVTVSRSATQTVKAPQPPVVFTGATSITPDDVWLVGGSTAAPSATAARRWDGTTWASVSTPNPCSQENYLTDIDAASSRDIWAVGGCTAADGSHTLAEHWNGTTWKVVPTPDIGPDDKLQFVDAVNHHAVWAVGLALQSAHGFLEFWDGKSWTLVDGPGPQLFDVSALSDSDVWTTDGHYAWHWDGSLWTRVDTGSYADTVEAVAHDDVWVGGHVDGRSFDDFIAHWDGSTWVTTPTPRVKGWRHRIQGIEAISPTDIWAFGMSGLRDQSNAGHVLHWNGTAWAVVQDHTRRGSGISGMTASDPEDAWAFGPIGGSDTAANLEHWNGSTWRRFTLT